MPISDKLIKINDEVVTQETLLAQIQTALEGKAVEGEGTDTSDATVTAADIIEDKIAYGSTGKITGTLQEISSNSATGFDGIAEYSSSAYGNVINIVTTVNYDVAFRTGSGLTLTANAEEFGNATTDDVLAGKTFTSSSGLKIEGTAPARSYETWVFELEDGSTVEKEIEVGA